MEPLHPRFRAMLKKAHPGLTDDDINRTEKLLAERMRCDPTKERERITELDRARVELIRTKMPRYTELAQVFRAEKDKRAGTQKTSATVRIKKTQK